MRVASSNSKHEKCSLCECVCVCVCELMHVQQFVFELLCGGGGGGG